MISGRNIMSDVKDLVLLGNKVVLRSFELDDIGISYLSWLNDPVVTKYSNQRFLFHTESSAKKYFESFENSSNIFLSIRTKEHNIMIGTITAYIMVPHRTADIGILVGDKNYWGFGMGQDAWDTLGNWLLDAGGMRKITGGTASGNVAMIRIMERFGMISEAVRFKQQIFDGIAHDLLYYAKFNEEPSTKLN